MIKSYFKIRQTLACSLHEIAKMLGPELTERDLFDVLKYLLHDKSSHPLL